MYMFILGTIFGAGLVLAVKTVIKELRERRITREEAREQRIQDEVNRRYNDWAIHNINIGKPVPPGPSFSKNSRQPAGPSTW